MKIFKFVIVIVVVLAIVVSAWWLRLSVAKQPAVGHAGHEERQVTAGDKGALSERREMSATEGAVGGAVPARIDQPTTMASSEIRPDMHASQPMPASPSESPKPPAVTADIHVDSANAAAELRGTEQMFAAHASLRTPEVANPDSATNREILQTMVAKALTHPTQPAAAPTASN